MTAYVTTLCGHDFPAKELKEKNVVLEEFEDGDIHQLIVCDVDRTEVETDHWVALNDEPYMKIKNRCMDCGVYWTQYNIKQKEVKNIIIIVEEH